MLAGEAAVFIYCATLLRGKLTKRCHKMRYSALRADVSPFQLPPPAFQLPAFVAQGRFRRFVSYNPGRLLTLDSPVSLSLAFTVVSQEVEKFNTKRLAELCKKAPFDLIQTFQTWIRQLTHDRCRWSAPLTFDLVALSLTVFRCFKISQVTGGRRTPLVRKILSTGIFYFAVITASNCVNVVLYSRKLLRIPSILSTRSPFDPI